MGSRFSLVELFGLRGKTALVTGSSRGIGQAIAIALAEAGAVVFVHGRKQGSADRTRKIIEAFDGYAHALSGDLSKAGMGTALVEKAEAAASRLDIVIINASAQLDGGLVETSEEELEFLLKVNLISTVEILQFCLPRMASRGWGRVVNVGSVNQSRPNPRVSGYAAIKAAQHNLVQSQARQYAKTGVVLNTLSPGLVKTDRSTKRFKGNKKAWKEYAQNWNWMGRAGLPKEMAGAAVFLSSPACSFMTGEVISLTGGY